MNILSQKMKNLFFLCILLLSQLQTALACNDWGQNSAGRKWIDIRNINQQTLENQIGISRGVKSGFCACCPGPKECCQNLDLSNIQCNDIVNGVNGANQNVPRGKG